MAVSKTEKTSPLKTTKPKTGTAKKAVATKSTVKKPAAPKKTTAKKTSTVKKAPVKKIKPSPEALYKMTEVAAYYIALNNGFTGNPSDYWIEAEAQISTLYK